MKIFLSTSTTDHGYFHVTQKAFVVVALSLLGILIQRQIANSSNWLQVSEDSSNWSQVSKDAARSCLIEERDDGVCPFQFNEIHR